MATMTRDEIAHLSTQERLTSIGDLWDSFGGSEPPLTRAQEEELDRRLRDFEGERGRAVGWERLKAELAERAP